VRQFDVALQLNPEKPALHNRGVSLGKLRRVAEALASFDCAIALQPDGAEAHSNRANALRALDRPEKALASSNRAIALKLATDRLIFASRLGNSEYLRRYRLADLFLDTPP